MNVRQSVGSLFKKAVNFVDEKIIHGPGHLSYTKGVHFYDVDDIKVNPTQRVDIADHTHS